MDEQHQELLDRIANLREHIDKNVDILGDKIRMFTKRLDQDLKSMQNMLMIKLNTRVAEIRENIGQLDKRCDEIKASLEREVEDRVRAVKEILVPIQRDVASLVVQLVDEKKIRKTKQIETEQRLSAAVDQLAVNIDVEKTDREAQYQNFKAVAEYECERILKRQYIIAAEMQRHLDRLDQHIQLETGNRLNTQDGIVQNMTGFIKAFQENIKEEATS